MQNLTTLNLTWLGPIGQLFTFVLIAAMILMHIMFGVCIWRDANQRQTAARPVVLLTPFVWMLVALVLGLIGIAFYWVCHHSRFYRIEK